MSPASCGVNAASPSDRSEFRALWALLLLALGGCVTHPTTTLADASETAVASDKPLAEPTPPPSGPWAPDPPVASKPGSYSCRLGPCAKPSGATTCIYFCPQETHIWS